MYHIYVYLYLYIYTHKHHICMHIYIDWGPAFSRYEPDGTGPTARAAAAGGHGSAVGGWWSK